MNAEVRVFDADAIQQTMDRNLAAGLRMLADAIESGQLEGRLMRAQAVGGRDDRAHIVVSIDVAAPVFTLTRGSDVKELPARLE